MSKKQPEYTIILKKTSTQEVLMQSKSDCLFITSIEDIGKHGLGKLYGGHFYNNEIMPETIVQFFAESIVAMTRAKGDIADKGLLDEGRWRSWERSKN